MLYHGQRGRVPWALDYTTRGNSNKGEMKAVAEWETPQDLKGVRSFLGFANYYRRFVPGYVELASPLTYLMKKDVQWVWGPPQRQAFQRIKEALCNAPLLQYPDPSLPYVVVTDASGQAAGGVLMQDQGEGLRPLAFMSRALKPTEQWYSAYERELATIAYCFVQWRHYLEGCPRGVIVMTDHKPLTLLMDQQVLSQSQRHGGFGLDYFNRSNQKLFINRARQMSLLMHSHGACPLNNMMNPRNETNSN